MDNEPKIRIASRIATLLALTGLPTVTAEVRFMECGDWFRSSCRMVSKSAPLVALALSSCVPAGEHEQVVTALLSEQAAHRKTTEGAAELSAKIDELKKLLEEKEAAYHSQELLIAQSRFDTQVVDKEREAAAQLVDQMRSELARVADNLRLYSNQKQELEAELEAALERAQNLVRAENRASMNAALIRDYTLLLPATLASGSTQLKLVQGRPQLRVPLEELKNEESDAPSPTAEAIIRATVKLLQRYPEVRLHLSASPPDPASAALLRALESQLQAAGVSAQQLVREVPDALTEGGEAGAGGAVVVWSFWVPD